MKTLLWKDLRQNTGFLVAAGIFLAIPYAVAFVVWALGTLKGDMLPYEGWLSHLQGAAVAGMSISVMLCAFVAGNAVAGERVDRSAEFFGYMPVPRSLAAASRVIVGIGLCVGVGFANFAIAFLSGTAISENTRDMIPADAVLLMMATGAFLFGVSWLFSALLRNPGNATGAGAATLALLFLALHWSNQLDKVSYVCVCVVLGIACLLGGVAYYVHRVEP